MTRSRQIEANRRDARKSAVPVTEDSKRRSRWNAVRSACFSNKPVSIVAEP
jgi:hypothetical protein